MLITGLQKLKVKMAHQQKGQLTGSGEWAKHLRKFLKRKFWKKERSAEKKLLEEEEQRALK